MASERKERIRAMVEDKGEVVSGICTRFSPILHHDSAADLDALEKEGEVIRTHGGAVSVKKLMGKGEETLTKPEPRRTKRPSKRLPRRYSICWNQAAPLF